MDIAGEVQEVGSNVTDVKKGSRVIALSAGYVTKNSADAAFQTLAKIDQGLLTNIPSALSYAQAAVIPLGFVTAAAALYPEDALQLPLPTIPPRKSAGNRALVVWGCSSSVGSFAIQLAIASGILVFTTASAKNHEYCKSLGATKVFDHSPPGDAATRIVEMLKRQHLELVGVFDVMSRPDTLKACAEISRQMGGGTIATTEPPPENLPKDVKGQYVTALALPLEKKELFGKLWKDYVPHALGEGALQAKPDPMFVKGGVEKAQEGMDKLKAGVSAQKVVLEIDGSL